MTTTEKLDQMKASEAKNAARIAAHIEAMKNSAEGREV